MKVVNIMLSAGAGGLEAVGFQYGRLLAEAGHDSWMICHARSPYRSTFGEKTIALPNASITNPLAHLRLARALRRIRPDVVFCHGHRAAQFYTPFLKIINHQPAYIAVCHGANGWRCRKFPRTIAVSDGVRDELVGKWGLSPSKVVTIPNAVPIPTLFSGPVPGKTGPVPVFGFLGRLDSCKGVDILLRAFARLSPDSRLVIGGTGPEEAELRKLAESLKIADRVTWLGWVSDKSLFFTKIDILLMPSREEALGLSMLEAMAYGKPVIVSDCPGPAALVRPLTGAACGMVVPREDVDALAQAMATLFADEELRQSFAVAGRALVESQYSESALRASLEKMVPRTDR